MTGTATSSGTELAELHLGPAALGELEAAMAELESGKGVLVRVADLMGGAVGQATRLGLRRLGLPSALQDKLRGLSESALARAFDVAILGLRGEGASAVPSGARGQIVRGSVIASGAIGGFAGFSGIAPDLGFTTLTIMREIGRIAVEQGEDLSTDDARRACLEVFALRSFHPRADESEIGYFSARLLMRGRPIVLLMSEVASRYGLAVSQKVATQMVPVAGAICGAALNAAFLAHYQSLARAHFTIRRLERRYGPEVRNAAERMRLSLHGQAAEA